MTNLGSILKTKISLCQQRSISQSYGFFSSHVQMWELDHTEGWALKNWCCRRRLRFPWTARRSNQSILKEINPEYSLQGLMLKLKPQYTGHLTWRAHWKRLYCWERLRAEGGGGDRERDGWMASLTQRTWVWASSGRQLKTGKPDVLQSRWSQRIRHDLAAEGQQLVLLTNGLPQNFI